MGCIHKLASSSKTNLITRPQRPGYTDIGRTRVIQRAHIYIVACKCVSNYINTYIYVYICVYVCMHVCVHMRMCSDMYLALSLSRTCIWGPCVSMCRCAYVCTYRSLYVYVMMYVCMHRARALALTLALARSVWETSAERLEWIARGRAASWARLRRA